MKKITNPRTHQHTNTPTHQHKDLDFLSQNRLIFMFQQNIVKQAQGFDYERWFRFAEKSRNRQNVPEDFSEFEGDEIFEEMMKRLNQSMLTEEDYEYIEHEQEMWEEVARLEQEYYEEGRREGEKEGEQKKAVEIARNLLKLGLDSTQIAQATGLPPADLASLKAE